MAATLASRVDAQISGTVSGQIAVGNHIIQNNVDHGGVVYMAAPGETPTPRPRARPVVLRGRRPPDPLGRDREVRAALDAIAAGRPMELVGPPGIGKTTILKHLTHVAPQEAGVDGVVYHEAHGEAVEDTLQFLYEAFYETSVPFKPNEAQIQHALADLRPLVVLDDVESSGRGVEQILDTLPGAGFLLGGASRSLWGGGCTSRPLRGLRRDAAVELLARELNRSLSDQERHVAGAIADAVDGQPLQLVQVAALVNDLGFELEELADDLQAGSAAPDELSRLLVATLDDGQRLILEVLVNLGGATLPAAELAELTGVAEAAPILESLMRLGLVQAHSPRYSVAGLLDPPAPGEAPAVPGDVERAYWTRWVDDRSRDPRAVVQEVQALLDVLRRAAREQAWADLVRLARRVEGPLLLAGRWGAWREVLELELAAARRLGDQAAEGWAQHQLGSRSLCLGDQGGARTALTAALRIRERLGDDRGADVTRHNLDLLGAQPVGRKPGDSRWGPPAAVGKAPSRVLPFVLPLLVGGLVAGGVIWQLPKTTGTGSGSRSAAVEPASIEFGDQVVGTSSRPQAVSVSNDGTGDLLVREVALTGTAPRSYRISRDGCSGVVLPAGDSCLVSVVFAPAEAAPQEATLTLGGADLEAREVALRGRGTLAPSPTGGLAVEPGRVDFGTISQGSPSTRSVRVRNTGAGQLRLQPVVVEGADAPDFALSGIGCPASLSPGSACSVDVTFTPRAEGPRVAGLTVRAADTGEARGAVLTGRGGPVVVPPERPDPPPCGLDIQAPASQTVAYGSVLRLPVQATSADPVRFTAVARPEGVTFQDNGDGTGVFQGTVLSAPGTLPITLAAASAGCVAEERFTLTIVPADLAFRWDQAVLVVRLGSSVSAAAVLTQVGGTQGDLTRASLRFDVAPCAELSRRGVPVDRSGRTSFDADPPLGVQNVTASLADSRYFRLVSATALTVVVVPETLNASATDLPLEPELLAVLRSLPCDATDLGQIGLHGDALQKEES